MRVILFTAAAFWFSTAVGGAFYLTRYEQSPGEAAITTPSVFPAASRLVADSSRPTLIFFAHPKCPCTRASLHELARLMADTGGKMNAYVVFAKPQEAPDDWTATDVVAIAQAIPGVQTIIDEREIETHLFHAETSGTALFYDRSRNLKFNGGITSARGHEGDNAGREAIFAMVTSASLDDVTTPVFGCPLHKKDCPGEILHASN